MKIYRLFFTILIVAFIVSCASKKYKVRQQPCDCPDIPQQPKIKKHSQMIPHSNSPENHLNYSLV